MFKFSWSKSQERVVIEYTRGRVLSLLQHPPVVIVSSELSVLWKNSAGKN